MHPLNSQKDFPFIQNESGVPFIYAIGMDGYDFSGEKNDVEKLRKDSASLIQAIKKTNELLLSKNLIPEESASVTILIGYALANGNGDISSRELGADKPPRFFANPPVLSWKNEESADGGKILISTRGLNIVSGQLEKFGLSKTESDNFSYLHELSHSTDFLLTATGQGGRTRSTNWGNGALGNLTRKNLGETKNPEINKAFDNQDNRKIINKWAESYSDISATILMTVGKDRKEFERISNAIASWRETCGKTSLICDSEHSVYAAEKVLLRSFPNGVPSNISYKEIDRISVGIADVVSGFSLSQTITEQDLVTKISTKKQEVSHEKASYNAP